MKTYTVAINKFAMLSGAVFAILVAFNQNASAAPHPLPPEAVPDAGATVMLLGVAFGALGMARRFLKN